MRFNDYYQIVNLTIEGAGETCVGCGLSVKCGTFRVVQIPKSSRRTPLLVVGHLGLEGIRKCVPLVASSASLMVPFFLSHQWLRHWRSVCSGPGRPSPFHLRNWWWARSSAFRNCSP